MIFVDLGSQDGAKLGWKIDQKSMPKRIGKFWSVLGPSWAVLGRLGAILRPTWSPDRPKKPNLLIFNWFL